MSPYIIPGLKSKTIRSLMLPTESNFQRVIEIVLEDSGKTKDDLKTKSRLQEISDLRMVCIWALRNNTTATLRQIGAYFNRDYTTVIHARDTIENLIKTKDPRIMGMVNKVNVCL